MANFGNAINWVLQLEDRGLRGIVVNLHDGGGLTRFGITSKNHPEAPADFYTKPAAAAIEDAKNIYHTSYWLPIYGGEFQTDELAATLLSFAVNDGVHEAVKLLQGVLGVAVDGAFGPGTLAAVRQISSEADVAERLREAQEAFYRRLGGQYLTGWLRRAGAVYPALP